MYSKEKNSVSAIFTKNQMRQYTNGSNHSNSNYGGYSNSPISSQPNSPNYSVIKNLQPNPQYLVPRQQIERFSYQQQQPYSLNNQQEQNHFQHERTKKFENSPFASNLLNQNNNYPSFGNSQSVSGLFGMARNVQQYSSPHQINVNTLEKPIFKKDRMAQSMINPSQSVINFIQNFGANNEPNIPRQPKKQMRFGQKKQFDTKDFKQASSLLAEKITQMKFKTGNNGKTFFQLAGPKKQEFQQNKNNRTATNFGLTRIQHEQSQKQPKGELQFALTSPSNMFKKKKNIGIFETKQNGTKLKEPLFKIVKQQYQINIPQEKVKWTKDDFQIGKVLGKGNFGQVVVAKHKKTGFVCCLKIMPKQQIIKQNYINQIARQLSIQFYLQHRCISPLYGYFYDANNIYLIMELCLEGQLYEKIKKQRRMEEQKVSRIIKQIIQGVTSIHLQDILHRDLKPQNILFNFGCIKISDFGWAVHRGHQMRKTRSGTPLYYPPQLINGKEYDEKVDIWSIGLMTYQCLYGMVPFRVYSQMDLNRIVVDEIKFPQYVDNVSDYAKDFILNTLNKNPIDRMSLKAMHSHPFITRFLSSKNTQAYAEMKKLL